MKKMDKIRYRAVIRCLGLNGFTPKQVPQGMDATFERIPLRTAWYLRYGTVFLDVLDSLFLQIPSRRHLRHFFCFLINLVSIVSIYSACIAGQGIILLQFLPSSSSFFFLPCPLSGAGYYIATVSSPFFFFSPIFLLSDNMSISQTPYVRLCPYLVKRTILQMRNFNLTSLGSKVM